MPTDRRARRSGPLLRRFAALEPARRRALAEAAAALALAALAIRLLPFRRLDRMLDAGKRSRPADDPAAAERIRWAVEAVSRHVPWRAMCFQQGLAAHWLLRRCGIDSRLHYGVASASDAGGIAAHVWVTIGGAVLVGGDVAPFRCLKTYPLGPSPGCAQTAEAPR